MSGSIAAAAVPRVSHDTTKNTRKDETIATADAVTPAGKEKTFQLEVVSKASVTINPVAIEAIAPARVAPCQLRPTASAGTSVDAKSPQPKIPRKATIVPERWAVTAAATAIRTVTALPQRSSFFTLRPNAIGRSWVTIAAPIFMNELAALIVAAATPENTSAASTIGVTLSSSVGVA